MYHVPVMLDETVAALEVQPHKTYLDATLGGGGHTSAILALGGEVAAIDCDDDAIEYCKARLQGGVTYIKGKYEDAVSLLAERGITSVAGAIMDLGVSSHQLDDPDRGFSYMRDGALDMRMDRSRDFTARDVVNGYSADELAKIIREYGEESYAKRIAAAIVSARKTSPIETTGQLSDIIVGTVPHRRGAHPAKKTFQAIRIEVNGELKKLRDAIIGIFGMIERGGRLAIISFHSLEDRIVKTAYGEFATDCICPKSFPVCVCGHKATGRLIGRIRPLDAELKNNPRSASATLRIIEKL